MNSLWLASTPQIHDLLDANGDRHAEVGHSVEDAAADPCLSLMIGQSPGVKRPADDGLVSVHRGFNEAPPGISGAALPSKAPMLFDRSRMVIALRRPGLARNGMITVAAGWRCITANLRYGREIASVAALYRDAPPRSGDLGARIG